MQACTGEELYRDESTEKSSLIHDRKNRNKKMNSENGSEKNISSENTNTEEDQNNSEESKFAINDIDCFDSCKKPFIKTLQTELESVRSSIRMYLYLLACTSTILDGFILIFIGYNSNILTKINNWEESKIFYLDLNFHFFSALGGLFCLIFAKDSNSEALQLAAIITLVAFLVSIALINVSSFAIYFFVFSIICLSNGHLQNISINSIVKKFSEQYRGVIWGYAYFFNQFGKFLFACLINWFDREIKEGKIDITIFPIFTIIMIQIVFIIVLLTLMKKRSLIKEKIWFKNENHKNKIRKIKKEKKDILENKIVENGASNNHSNKVDSFVTMKDNKTLMMNNNIDCRSENSVLKNPLNIKEDHPYLLSSSNSNKDVSNNFFKKQAEIEREKEIESCNKEKHNSEDLELLKAVSIKIPSTIKQDKAEKIEEIPKLQKYENKINLSQETKNLNQNCYDYVLVKQNKFNSTIQRIYLKENKQLQTDSEYIISSLKAIFSLDILHHQFSLIFINFSLGVQFFSLINIFPHFHYNYTYAALTEEIFFSKLIHLILLFIFPFIFFFKKLTRRVLLLFAFYSNFIINFLVLINCLNSTAFVHLFRFIWNICYITINLYNCEAAPFKIRYINTSIMNLFFKISCMLEISVIEKLINVNLYLPVVFNLFILLMDILLVSKLEYETHFKSLEQIRLELN